MLASAASDKWLPWTCDKLNVIVGSGDIGICACRVEEGCWSDQLVYRAEAAGVVVFVALLLMAVSGCAEGASRSYAVAKFLAVLVVSVVLLFAPNSVLSTFGTVATSTSAIFLVVQSVVLVDLGYSWNELWYGNARRHDTGGWGFHAWLASILAASGLLFCSSVAGSIYLFAAYPNTSGRCVNLIALVLSFVLTLVSITDYAKNGALLTSCFVMAYTTWLTCEALAVLPNGDGPTIPPWVGLSVCALALVFFSQGTDAEGVAPPGDRALDLAEAGRGPVAKGAAGESGSETESSSGSDRMDFIKQCSVHTAAALYVAATLAPEASSFTFALHAAAVFLSLALYSWTLVAPTILTDRIFS